MGRPLTENELTARGFDPSACNCTNKIRICGLHDLCTTADLRPGMACCRTCPDHPDYLPPQRHLLYHVYPLKGNGVWQMNVERLRARFPLFTGRRVVAIATGTATDPPEAVQEAFGNDRVDHWIVQPNDGGLREVATWRPLWEQVANLPGVTFYAHAKGVTRPVNRGTTIHRWAAMMYAANLDYWPAVEAELATHPIAGTFKKVGMGFQGSRSSWHYSGSFFWIRNEAIGERWRTIDSVWWGNESWPGCHFRPDEAGCVFKVGVVPTLDLYAMPVLERIEAEFETWKLQNTMRRTVTSS